MPAHVFQLQSGPELANARPAKPSVLRNALRSYPNFSRVIESVVNDENLENPPTLAQVRTALVGGLGARLVGEGVLEDDDDDTLVSEIDALIEHHGADALAEDFLRYE